MKRLGTRLSVLLVSAFILFTMILAPAAKAVDSLPVCQDAAAQRTAVCQDAIKKGGTNVVSGPTGVIQTATNLIALTAGIAAVISIIASGISYATAGGAQAGQRAGDNPTKAKNARNALTNSAIGLVVVALSWAIASYVIQHVVNS